LERLAKVVCGRVEDGGEERRRRFRDGDPR
jgi:hypothetical protein